MEGQSSCGPTISTSNRHTVGVPGDPDSHCRRRVIQVPPPWRRALGCAAKETSHRLSPSCNFLSRAGRARSLGQRIHSRRWAEFGCVAMALESAWPVQTVSSCPPSIPGLAPDCDKAVTTSGVAPAPIVMKHPRLHAPGALAACGRLVQPLRGAWQGRHKVQTTHRFGCTGRARG
jgi:hypothetical protein